MIPSLAHEGAIDLWHRDGCVLANKSDRCCLGEMDEAPRLDDLSPRNRNTETHTGVKPGRSLQCNKGQGTAEEGVVDSKVFVAFVSSIPLLSGRQEKWFRLHVASAFGSRRRG